MRQKQPLSTPVPRKAPRSEWALQEAWYRQATGRRGHTVSGLALEVLHPGQPNLYGGPDFSEARIRIGGLLWVGSVEIHTRSSDWRRHGHTSDARYESVILHVVVEPDERVVLASGETLETWVWEGPLPSTASSTSASALERQSFLPHTAGILPSERDIRAWAQARLQRKAHEFHQALDETGGDLFQVFYESALGHLGFVANKAPMQALAQQLPWQALKSYAGSQSLRAEVALLGQAGFLQEGLFEQAGPVHQAAIALYERDGAYWPKPLAPHRWQWMRQRPWNYPTQRLAQVAAWVESPPFVWNYLLGSSGTAEAFARWVASQWPSPYYQERYRPGPPLLQTWVYPREATAQHLLTNTWIPLQAALGRETSELLAALAILPPEDNRFIRALVAQGWPKPQNRLEAQAYIQFAQQEQPSWAKVYTPPAEELSGPQAQEPLPAYGQVA